MKFVIPLILASASIHAGAESPAPKGVDVALVSENRAITAGKPFTVGLKIHHHEKYHTYWKNPGIAGVATAIAWELPAGFSAGPIQWPRPEKSFMAKYPVHGYERDVILLVDILPPADLPAESVHLKATATWMACAEGCYPGKIDLELALPVSPETAPDPVQAEAIARARTELPQAFDGSAKLLSAADAAEIRIEVKPAASKGDAGMPADLYFFSEDGQISSDKPQKIERMADGSILITATRAKYSPEAKKALPGVLSSASTALNKDGAKFALIAPVYPAAP